MAVERSHCAHGGGSTVQGALGRGVLGQVGVGGDRGGSSHIQRVHLARLRNLDDGITASEQRSGNARQLSPQQQDGVLWKRKLRQGYRVDMARQRHHLRPLVLLLG